MSATKSQIPGWLTEKEVQNLLQLRTTTLWKLRTDGQLKFSKIGRRTYYKEDSVIQLLEKNMVE